MAGYRRGAFVLVFGAVPRPDRPPRTTTVAEVSRLTPSMVRIVVTGPELDGFTVGEFTDHYVKCRFGERTRSYTVRDFDPARRRLTLDFVVHGDEGLAGPWAGSAAPGDTLVLNGPGGAYAPSPNADWHLMVGDDAVIPAVAVSLQRVPAGTPVFVVLEVDDAAHEQPLSTPGDLHLTWLHRDGAPGEDPEMQLQAVRGLTLPPGRGHAFVHGEANAVMLVRRHLIQDRGFGADQLSATGYWKRRRTDEQWRADKRDWLAEAERDLT